MLKQGCLYRYEGRIWRCGLVNVSRARLDPVSGFQATSPVSGKGSFTTYGTSVNVGSNSDIPEVAETDLSDGELRRLMRMEEDAMAVAAPPVGGKTAGKAAAPAATGPSVKEQNEARRKKLAEEKEAAKKDREAKRAADKEAREAAKNKPCKCGCGGTTTGNFVPGHDARFKGWLLQIERGQKKPEELLTAEVRSQYKWKKSADGKGLIPTTNYKGEPHAGYDTQA